MMIWGKGEGQRRRDTAIAQLELAIFPTVDPWTLAADHTIRTLARLGEPFDAERIRQECGDPTRPGLIGSRLLAAAKKGLIQKTGNYRVADRPERRGGVLAEWVGTPEARQVAS